MLIIDAHLLAKKDCKIAFILDDERPVIIGRMQKNKYGRAIHPDICANQLALAVFTRMFHAEMDMT